MHQSRKEQGYERSARKLLLAERGEAVMMAAQDIDSEAAEEWEGMPKHCRSKPSGRL